MSLSHYFCKATIMLKTSYLVFLVAIAVAVSRPSVDAKPMRPRNLKDVIFRAERDITSDELLIPSDEVNELSPEFQELLTKHVLVGLLLSTVDSDNSAEIDELTLKFKKAVEQKWDSLDDFATHLLQIYENVTGRKPDTKELENAERKMLESAGVI